jgi:hypothetical protein
MLVISGAANAAVAPANANRFIASRREMPSRTRRGVSSKPLPSSCLIASRTSPSETGAPRSDSTEDAMSPIGVLPSQRLKTEAARALRQCACLSAKSYTTSSSPTRSIRRSFDLAIGTSIAIAASIDFLDGMAPFL